MTMAKRILGWLLHVAALSLFLFLYTPLYRRVEAYAAAHMLSWLLLAYEAGMAFLPALYLRCILALLRRGERQKTRFAVDPSGVISVLLLAALGVWSRFSDALALTVGGAFTYYCTAFWLALLCCVRRAPCSALSAAPSVRPAPAGAPAWAGTPPAQPESFEALQEEETPPNEIRVEIPAAEEEPRP